MATRHHDLHCDIEAVEKTFCNGGHEALTSIEKHAHASR